jgi:uroporphyrinogen-III synthase
MNLAGRTVVVTRPREQAAPLCAALAAHGAIPMVFPTIEVRAVDNLSTLDRALDALETYAWLVFTSVNGVRFFFERLDARRGGKLTAGLRVAAVGPATARAIAQRGLTVDAVPDEHRGARIAAALGELAGRRVLLPRAEIGREEVVAELLAQGAAVDDVPVYHTVPATPDPDGLAALRRGVDVVTFTSPSTVRNFLMLLGADARDLLRGAIIACIGPVTADAARELGLPVHVQPAGASAEGLVEALAAYQGERSGNRQ